MSQTSVDVIKKEIDASLAATQEELATQKTTGLAAVHPEPGGAAKRSGRRLSLSLRRSRREGRQGRQRRR